MKHIITILLIVVGGSLFAQDQVLIDSLSMELEKAKHDTTKLLIEIELEEAKWNMRIGYWDSLSIRANKIKFLKVESDAVNNIGYVYQSQGDNPNALTY
jgi:hypothetical protein